MKTFQEMNAEEKKAILCAWVDGRPVQVKLSNGEWKRVEFTTAPYFYPNRYYRLKPEPKKIYLIRYEDGLSVDWYEDREDAEQISKLYKCREGFVEEYIQVIKDE